MQLVKVVIQSMLTHIITCFSGPISILKEIEIAFRNFIWSGAINKKKLVLVSWENMCKPILHGGLGLISLTILNQATKLKLSQDLTSSTDHWAIILRGRVLKNYGTINYHIFSTIWSSIKSVMFTINS